MSSVRFYQLYCCFVSFNLFNRFAIVFLLVLVLVRRMHHGILPSCPVRIILCQSSNLHHASVVSTMLVDQGLALALLDHASAMAIHECTPKRLCSSLHTPTPIARSNGTRDPRENFALGHRDVHTHNLHGWLLGADCSSHCCERVEVLRQFRQTILH